jgi:MFS family permease
MVVKKLKSIVPAFSKDDNIFRTRQIQENELPWIRTRHIWTGILGTIYGTFLGPAGIYFTFFCFASGMSKYQLGIMASLVSFAVVFQIFSWVFEDFWGNRKYPWYVFSILSRLCFIPIVFSFWIPLGPLSIIVLCSVSAVFGNLAAPPWSSWLYDLISEDQLAGFMSRRSAVIQFFIMGIALFAALAVQQSDQAHKMMIVRLVFAFGLTLGIIDLIFHVQIPEPHKKTQEAKSDFLKVIAQPWSDKKFRQWMLIMLLWTVSMNICEPFFIPYLMKDLGFENRFVLLTVISVCLVQMSGFISFLFWGKIIEKIGTRKVFLICHCLWSVIPLFYLLSASVKPILLISIAWIITGIFVNGTTIVNPAITSILTKGKKRSTYLAVMTITSSMFGGLGTLIGSLIVKYFSIWHVFPVSLIARISSFVIMFIVMFNGRIYDKSDEAVIKNPAEQ